MEHLTIIGRYRAEKGLVDEDDFITLDLQARLRHIAVFGKAGVGKTTLLTCIVARDAEHDGLLLIDPNTDLARTVIDSIPANQRYRPTIHIEGYPSECCWHNMM
jgi:ABC-type lipoprotein export system ATPase subunit